MTDTSHPPHKVYSIEINAPIEKADWGVFRM